MPAQSPEVGNKAFSISVKCEIKDVSDAWLKTEEQNIKNALGAMANAILQRSRMVVPKESGDLSLSGRVEGKDFEREVIYGENGVVYARYQEYGERQDGTHVVRNYTTPGTGKEYLKNTGDTVVEEGLEKFL